MIIISRNIAFRSPTDKPEDSHLLGVILSVALYWCKAWPFQVSEEHSLNAYEKRALKRIFESTRTQGYMENYIMMGIHNL
jgi:hypothetical protein